jgi:ubiquitin-conjugating enzyme E2 S
MFIAVIYGHSPPSFYSQQANAENISPAVAQKLMREVRALMKDAPEDIQIHLDEENLTSIEADIAGPTGTPYAGGVFRARLVFGADFPQSPPKGYFLTKIFHPNVSKTGDICVNTLKRDWTPELSIKHVFCVIRCLLIEPNAESALNEEAGKLLLEQYEDFAKRAAMYTKIHARPANASADAPVIADAVPAGGSVAATAPSASSNSAASAPALVSAPAAAAKPKPAAAPAAKKSSLKRL